MSDSLPAQVLDGNPLLEAFKLRLAAQRGPQRYRRGLEALARDIDQGHVLATALQRQRPQLPRDLQCLLDEAMQVADPIALVLEAVQFRQSAQREWMAVWRLILYPLLLLILALVIGSVFAYVTMGSQFAPYAMYETFGFSGVERYLSFYRDQYQAILGLTLLSGWTLLIAGTLVCLGPRWAWTAVLGGVWLIGGPLRWISMRELLQRYRVFVDSGLPTLAASQAVARSLRRSGQSMSATAIADRIAMGLPLGEAFCRSLLSDGLTRPALRLLDLRGHELPRAMDETAWLLGTLTEQRSRSLTLILPVFAMLFVGSIIWATFSAYVMAFMPMVSMISSLA